MMLMMGCHTITIIIISNENPFRFLLLYLSLLLLFSYNMHKASFHCTDIHLQVKKIHKRSSYNQGKLVTQLQFSSAFWWGKLNSSQSIMFQFFMQAFITNYKVLFMEEASSNRLWLHTTHINSFVKVPFNWNFIPETIRVFHTGKLSDCQTTLPFYTMKYRWYFPQAREMIHLMQF